MTHTYTHTLTPPQQAKQIHATYVAEDILLSRRTRQRQESDLVFESAYEGRLLSVSGLRSLVDHGASLFQAF